MLGVALLDRAGLLDARTLAMPPSDVAGQVIGAVLFGVGFALAALCPGTACVAAASGRRHGLLAVGGVLAGTLLAVPLWPVVEPLLRTPVRDGATLAADLGVPHHATVGAVAILGVVVLSLARVVDARRAGSPAAWRLSRGETILLTLGAAIALVGLGDDDRGARAALRRSAAAIAAEIDREADHVDPLELATWIRDGVPGLRVIDVRHDVEAGAYVIPGAESVPLDSVPMLRIAPDARVVLYSDGGTHAAQGWVLLRALGHRNVWVLRDGLAAWEDEVLHPVAPAHDAPAPMRDRFARARAVSLWFGGRPRTDGEADGERRPATQARPRRRNTC
jgi:rhodanese-related sulfurtransferase